MLDHFLHLSIHEICSDSRVGPSLWSSNSSVRGDFNIVDFELIKSTENPLAITFWALFGDQWKLFDISTTQTDALIKFDLKVKELKWVRENSVGLSEIFMKC